MGLETFARARQRSRCRRRSRHRSHSRESADYRRILAAHHLDTIFLGAPTSTDERLAKIAAVSFRLSLSHLRTGVTGAKDALPMISPR